MHSSIQLSTPYLRDNGITLQPIPTYQLPETSNALPPHVEHGILAATTNHAPVPSPFRSNLQLTATLLALFLTLFLAALDFTIATTALPTITSSLRTDSSAYTWIGASYLLASAASTPVWVSFADVFGRKPVLLTAVAVFFAGSAICAAAQSMISLIAGRVIQGAAAGGVIVLVNVGVSDLFSMRARGFYLGLTGVVWGLASGVGPFLGGILTQYVSWRWNWWINLPISGTTFLVLFFCYRVHNPRTNVLRGLRAIDWLGTVAILGLSIMILLGLNIGGVFSPWNSSKVICLLVFGFFISFVFIVYEARLAKNPLMPLHIFYRRSNTASLLVCFCHGFVNISSWYYLPLYLQSVLEVTPLRSGILILPITIVQAVVGVLAGVIVHRTGIYLELIWIGMSITALGFGLFVRFGVDSSWAEIVVTEILAGTGVGLVFQPPLIALQSLVETDNVAAATALFGFLRSLSTSVSIVVGGAIFQNEMQSRYDDFRTHLPVSVAEMLSGNTAAANIDKIGNLTDPQKDLIKSAFAQSLKPMWILYASTAGFGLLISFWISKQKLSIEHVDTITGLKDDKDLGSVANNSNHATMQQA